MSIHTHTHTEEIFLHSGWITVAIMLIMLSTLGGYMMHRSTYMHKASYMQLTCATFPTMTESTSFGSTPPSDRAARDATALSSVADSPLSAPPNVLNGVRLAATIKTPRAAAEAIFPTLLGAWLCQRMRLYPATPPHDCFYGL